MYKQFTVKLDVTVPRTKRHNLGWLLKMADGEAIAQNVDPISSIIVDTNGWRASKKFNIRPVFK